MGTAVGLLLLTVLCLSVGGVQGVCRPVKNDDMIEYSCVGGQPSDLDSLPESTGKIRITNMPISRITADTFSRFGSDLWVLGCSYCEITDIEPNAFQHLVNLQQLSLDNNYLNIVKESWFRGLNYLTYLDLNYNSIMDIEDGVFKNLPSLVDLRLSGNRLECLNLEAMSHLKELKRIFLGENSEFKCPNAVSYFLEEHGVSFERDPAWDKIPVDLVSADVSFDYYSEYDEVSTPPTTSLPTYRERLHLTSAAPPSTLKSTPYVAPRLYTTEEVIHRPALVTTDRQTIPMQTTVPYEPRRQTTTSRSPYDERTAVPRIVASSGPMTNPPYDTTPYTSLSETTSRSWPTFPEPSNTRPDFPLYPPHENEDKQYEQPRYPSATTDSFSLAAGPSDRYETSAFVEPMERTTVPVMVEWPEMNTVILDTRIDGGKPSEYTAVPTHTMKPSVQTIPPVPTNTMKPSVQAIPLVPPEMIQPASPDNSYQAPYYEHTITVHSPPLGSNNKSREEEPGVTPIQTTTDKPLPNCSHRNLSSLMERSFALVLLSILLVAMRDVLVEGF